jgi:hypothetical protein
MVNKELKSIDVYDGLSTETRGKLTYLAGEIRRASARATEDFLAICAMYAQARDEFKTDRKESSFKDWVEQKCGVAQSTAYNYISVHEKFSKFQSIGTLSPVCLIRLSAKNVQDSAVQEAIELSQLKKVTVSKTQAIILEHRPEPAAPVKQEMIDAEFTVIEESEPEPPRQRQPIDKKQQAANLRNEILQHNAKMMRLVDDLNNVYLDKEKHSIVHKAFREIHATVEAWK